MILRFGLDTPLWKTFTQVVIFKEYPEINIEMLINLLYEKSYVRKYFFNIEKHCGQWHFDLVPVYLNNAFDRLQDLIWCIDCYDMSFNRE